MNKKGEMSYGFASNLRDALPNASFIGFTGTPIEKADANTRTVFGDHMEAMDGKAMIVCMSRCICVDLFNALIKLRPVQRQLFPGGVK